MNDMVAEDFYQSLKPITRFSDGLDESSYLPLPADWLVGVSDVVDSTAAIAEGRYKAVNMVGASVISAVRNVLGGRQFPFVFGGDGAGFAVEARAAAEVGKALAACQTWAAEEIGLTLRTALVPVADIRAAGFEISVARHTPAAEVSYAMFTGGGLSWAESAMKRGDYALPPAEAGTRPNLEGLSCRWAPIHAERGDIISLIVLPRGSPGREFTRLLALLLQTLRQGADGGHPVPEAGPPFALPSRGLDLEARASAAPVDFSRTRRRLRLVTLFAWFLGKTGWKFKEFDPNHYRARTALNTDFRKFDDGLKLTVDCDRQVAARIEEILAEAKSGGVCYYGIHRQDSALMTCIVPSPYDDDHMHFVDGAAGGYAQAAGMLKAQLKAGDVRQSAGR